ncbi:hypothetical protein FGO68_gene14496 [Halteria grandinella]|uniref:DNA-directed RNA polymerase subunit P n=1 Tax=Halteria grandinella TaxID=5974 RepID=A0A8J8T3J7_HALGN|nr:hypothetical protein FGO68_gene14496 [Halteria grandinella]
MSGGVLGDDLEQTGRELPKVSYICGGCGREQKLDKDAVIRCMHCSHRIFYKRREKKLLQYLAR